MNNFLMKHFDTVEEREEFLKWYNFDGYRAWLFVNGYTSTIDNLKTLLNKRFENLDIEQAKQDVLPFIKDKTKLDLWSKEFFIEITKKLQSV